MTRALKFKHKFPIKHFLRRTFRINHGGGEAVDSIIIKQKLPTTIKRQLNLIPSKADLLRIRKIRRPIEAGNLLMQTE
jgi:hypothetical protein